MTLSRQWLLLLILFGMGVGITAWWYPRPSPPSGHELSVMEARQLDSILWIDARSETEYAQGHIPSALNLNEDNWSRQIEGVLTQWTPTQPVVVYCGSASCEASRHVADRLRGENYQLDLVWVLKGGWEEWCLQGGTMAQ